MKLKVKINIEVEVEVEGKFFPEKYGSFYKSNGDPGEPPEQAQFEIHNVKWDSLDITEKLDKEGFDWNSLEEEIIEIIENEG